MDKRYDRMRLVRRKFTFPLSINFKISLNGKRLVDNFSSLSFTSVNTFFLFFLFRPEVNRSMYVPVCTTVLVLDSVGGLRQVPRDGEDEVKTLSHGCKSKISLVLYSSFGNCLSKV